MLRKFTTALQFLTIITINKRHVTNEDELLNSVVWFPVVGFVIGLILVYADQMFALAALPNMIANLLVIAVSVLITRALHIDGLGDTLDGLMGGRDPESRLAIMRDSRLGTAGALGIFFVVTLKYLCLNNLYGGEKVVALLTAPVIGRWSQMMMAYRARYARENGMARVFIGRIRPESMTAISAIAVGLSAFVIIREDARSAFLFFGIVIGALALTHYGKRFIARRIGGITGDAIGAMSELNETLALLCCVVFSTAR